MQLRLAGDLVARPRTQWNDSLVASLLRIPHNSPGNESGGIQPRSLLLEYYLAGQDLYLFQLGRGMIEVHCVEGVVPKIERLLALWRVNLELVGQASATHDYSSDFAGLQENCRGLLERLYDLLLAPVADVLPTYTHLTVVPYGVLHYLPFHALFDGQQFLTERLHISYLPAAALLDICQQRAQRVKARRMNLVNSLVMGL